LRLETTGAAGAMRAAAKRNHEVRQLFELEDFGPSEAVERFLDMGIGAKK